MRGEPELTTMKSSWLQGCAELSIEGRAATPASYRIKTRRCIKCNAICNDPRMTKCYRCGGRIE